MRHRYKILSWIELRGRSSRLSLLITCVFVTAGNGCTSLGPMVIPRDRFNYNEAVARSNEQQLLLNLVRMRHDRAPVFLQVASLLSQYTLEAGANVGKVDNNLSAFKSPLLRAVLDVNSDPGRVDRYGANIRFTDTPTITYVPVQGEDYATRIMTPIPLETLVLLAQSGRDLEQLLFMTVARMNYLRNVRPSGGAIDETVSKFGRAVFLMDALRVHERVLFGVESAGSRQKAYLYNLLTEDDPESETLMWLELCDLLRLDPKSDKIEVVLSPIPLKKNQLAVFTRSFVDIMFVLSNEESFLNAREHDKPESAKTGLPESADTGSLAEQPLLRVLTSPLPPLNPYVAIFYRGQWYYIADWDNVSKNAFWQLADLYSLTSGGWESALPMVTVSAGGAG